MTRSQRQRSFVAGLPGAALLTSTAPLALGGGDASQMIAVEPVADARRAATRWHFILVVAALALAACGNSNEAKEAAIASSASSEDSPTTTAPATTTTEPSKNRTAIEMSGAITFKFDGAGGKCSTVTKENFSEDADPELVMDMTGYEFDSPDPRFDLTLFDWDNDGSIDSIILNGSGDGAHWSLGKGSGRADGRTDLKGVTFDVELGSLTNRHPPVTVKGSITCS